MGAFKASTPFVYNLLRRIQTYIDFKILCRKISHCPLRVVNGTRQRGMTTERTNTNDTRLPSWATQKWSPKARSIFSMALASAFHFAGYEYGRTGALTLLTSERSGFSSSSIVPFAMGCVSPFSLLLLWLYIRMLDYSGPSMSLRNCTLLYAFVLIFCGVLLQSLDNLLESNDRLYNRVSKYFLLFLFITENCFVQLLYSQHWAFMSSVQTKEEAAVWFPPIAGVGSIASTAAALTVPPLIGLVGLPGLLVLSGCNMLISACFAIDAYQRATKHSFAPAPHDLEKKANANSQDCEQNFFQRAFALFIRVPILGALCIEVIFSQCQTSLLNSLFVLKMKEVFPNDDERARYTGNCYACINGFSGLLQFGVLPLLVKRMNTRQLWLVMPSTMMACAALIYLRNASDIYLVSGSFLLMKAMEYSIRGVTSEMVYVSLDYESRFLGKEIIGVFVNRVGKSATAMGLSALTSYLGSQFHLSYLSAALVVVATAWLLVCFRLTRLLGNMDRTGTKEQKAKTE